MSGIRKKGELKFEGAAPMKLVELDGQVEEWTPAQEAAFSAVTETIKAYMKTTKSLAAGKYAHLTDKIPEYMATPGNVLVAICADGVVIRYERKAEEVGKLAVMMMKEDIVSATSVLSQNLIHIQSTVAPIPEAENFGVEVKLAIHSPTSSISRDLFAGRIWFQVASPEQQTPQQNGAKPYCLLSVRNRLELEIHGEISDVTNEASNATPFIAHSELRLAAGWECIEAYPGFVLESWNAALAPLWAENDLLGAVLITETRNAQLRNLDPRSATRRHYASILADFRTLLDSEPEREQTLQTFLQNNPFLLSPTHVEMWPKLALGSTVTDFVFREANNEYLLVELERSTLKLFKQDGHATAELNHALGQIVDWKRYIEDNLRTVQLELGLKSIASNPMGLVVIGRSNTLTTSDRRKLQTMANDRPKSRILTYDDVYESSKALLENMLGPMWDMGGLTQVFFPEHATANTRR